MNHDELKQQIPYDLKLEYQSRKATDGPRFKSRIVYLIERIARAESKVAELEAKLAQARKEALEEAAKELEFQASAPAPVFDRMADESKQRFGRILLNVTAAGIRALIAKEPA